MATLSPHHQTLILGVGRCSVPMWSGGLPAGFCDELAYGKQVPDCGRGGDYGPGWRDGRWYSGGVWNPVYCSGLACYAHGGPAKSLGGE